MILSNACGHRPAVRTRKSSEAFTLIELLAVMVIILVLAGLILNVAGNAQYKSAMARATAEIKQMETAMETYKADNGAYPQGPAVASNANPPPQTSTDALNAQTYPQNYDPSNNALYSAAGTYLFQQLSGRTDLATSNPTPNFSKAYITFLPGQLSTGSSAATPATYIVDPFGFCYGYSTANAYAVAYGQTTSTAGYNPTFDLWSTAGYSPSSGKMYPSTATNAAQCNALWVKNW